MKIISAGHLSKQRYGKLEEANKLSTAAKELARPQLLMLTSTVLQES